MEKNQQMEYQYHSPFTLKIYVGKDFAYLKKQDDRSLFHKMIGQIPIK